MAALLGAPAHGLSVSVTIEPPVFPVDAAFSGPGPDATSTGVVTNAAGQVIDDTFYPTDYGALGFASPIVTWGNGSDAVPAMYTTLLSHLASYGFTVIAPVQENTGSGRALDAAARYLVAQNTTPGSVFFGHLDPHHVAAVGHSQGATGAVNAATADRGLITTVMTFSLPNAIWSGANPDCATAAICTPHPNELTQPVFFISTHGVEDTFIANPPTEQAYQRSVPGRAVSGIIAFSEGALADHSSVQNENSGGAPDDELGYATAWLEYQLRHDAVAATAFSGSHPELLSNLDWPDSTIKVGS
jgi:hypothetical protein